METKDSIDWKRFLLETGALAITAILCALIANLLAGRERNLALVADYPTAQKVPQRSQGTAAAPAAALSAPAPPDAAVSLRETPAPAPTSAAAAKGTPAPLAGATPAPDPSARVRIIENRLGEEDLLKRFPASPDTPYREISPDDATTLFQSGALFIDARRTKVFQEGHIAGARSISVWESDTMEKILALVNEGRRQDLPLVVYCSGGECEDSHMLSEKLFGAGFTNLLVYKEGFPDWVKRGGKTARGLTP